ncbi:sulfite exporter TauE/SafE family protein [Microbulbifer thermotolerans]|uniref:sulfite exporter TauE/SafE family protein n=1 Tax=Microbulbifer thermotolerans TaxID=252514 RepID=UPI00224ABFD0|nr:sulfite exporter TauE/SafE family protein [Microbulbifer thermotolerans]MCX2842282.1 sulfite exporter TauE/SafE family protein [Microbulbifer thermotolerans]
MGDWGFLAAALAVGFFGSSHCIGMCGGVASALGMAVPGQQTAWTPLICYSAGRLSSYAFMGALAGALGAAALPTLTPLRLLAGLMLIAMALYIAGIWRGLVWLEKGGAHLWRYLRPLSEKLLPVKSAPQALALGALWGWLPCGLVYSALTFALAQGSALRAALAMLAFGLGTVPAMLATGAAAAQVRSFMQKPAVRLLFAGAILLFGGWTLWGALGHGGHAGHDHTPAVESMDHQHQEHQHHHH